MKMYGILLWLRGLRKVERMENNANKVLKEKSFISGD